ncbi:MAG: hypothetical protein ABIB47_05195 [Candidatus Woesearchaeota archaeon]
MKKTIFIGIVLGCLFMAYFAYATVTNIGSGPSVGQEKPPPDGLCTAVAPTGACIPSNTWCATISSGSCQYTCQGMDGTVGSWGPGVYCGAGSTCTPGIGLGSKCEEWAPGINQP